MIDTLDRRRFLGALATVAATAMVPRALLAQQEEQQGDERVGATNMPMDQDRYRPVRLPAKSSTPSMTAAQRDVLEHRIHCQCGCNLDIYTCRTTDFTCQVSPAMHKDVMALVAGGYSAQEIINAFVHTYGEKVLMAPEKRGFNLAGYYTPFIVLAAGIALVLALLRRWHRPAAVAESVQPLPVDATPEEIARLDALLRRDDE